MSYGSGYHPGYPTLPGYRGPVRDSAPPSVHLVAILLYFGAAAQLLVAALVAAAVAGAVRRDQYLPTEYLRTATIAIAAVFAFGGLVTVVVGRRLQRGRQWARVLVLVLSGVLLAWTLYNGLVGPGDRANALGGLVAPVLYLVLLNTRAARSWFTDRSY